MYLTNCSNDVRNYFNELEKVSELSRLKVMAKICEYWSLGQINNQNIPNPHLVEDDDSLKIFLSEDIGQDNHFAFSIAIYLLCNIVKQEQKELPTIVIQNSIDEYITYHQQENKLLSMFGDLSFKGQIITLAELIIRLDNKELAPNIIDFTKNNPITNGYEIARNIQDYLRKIVK